ncbi:MAG: transcription elongation factor GreA [Lachnospiraceae bacterium]|nr:transcription elongation factor GreA [Lachnospiraceae bacterium]
MSEKKVVLTYEGLKKREEELEELKTVRRKDVAEKIKEARGQGDLSENAEYDSAKEEQAEIEARIVFLEKMLRNAEVIDEEEVSKDVISVGCTVRLFDVEFDEEVDYTIVGSAEADPMDGKISNESPVGMGLLGHKTGETVVITAPEGEIEFKVIEILNGNK